MIQMFWNRKRPFPIISSFILVVTSFLPCELFNFSILPTTIYFHQQKPGLTQPVSSKFFKRLKVMINFPEISVNFWGLVLLMISGRKTRFKLSKKWQWRLLSVSLIILFLFEGRLLKWVVMRGLVTVRFLNFSNLSRKLPLCRRS